MKNILYLHGFLSSPASIKVKLLREGLADRAWVVAPDLNTSPLEADRTIAMALEEMTRENQETIVVGSSLGGFYAARAAVRFGLRAVLLNPCLNPWERVLEWTGHREIYGTDRTLDVYPSFAEDFKRLSEDVDPLKADRSGTLVVLSTADEVLPWKNAEEAYSHARQMILPGEDHRITNFSRVVPRIIDFVLDEKV